MTYHLYYFTRRIHSKQLTERTYQRKLQVSYFMGLWFPMNIFHDLKIRPTDRTFVRTEARQ